MFGVNELFVKRNYNYKDIPIMAKVTDDFLAAGPPAEVIHFMKYLQDGFKSERFVSKKRFRLVTAK